MKAVVFVLLVIFCYFKANAGSSEPTALALNVIQQHQKQLIAKFEGTEGTNTAAKIRYLPLVNLLGQLQTNWADTINKPLNSLPQNVQKLLETFQFYFNGRTNLDNPDINTLVNPPWPLNLDATNFSSEDWHNLQISDIRVRVAWFRLLPQLQSKAFLEENPMSMNTAAITLQNLNELYVRGLNKYLSPYDFETIREAVNTFPPFTDAYIQKLVKLHTEESHGDDLFSHVDRATYYKGFASHLPQTISGWYNAIWNENPTVLEPTMTAQYVWINSELDYFSDLLNAAGKIKAGNNNVIPNVQKFLNASLRDVNHAGVPHATSARNNTIPKVSDSDLALVRDFHKHFHFEGQDSDVDYVSECSEVVPSLKSGSWTEAVKVVQPNDISVNLTLPIQEFADYAKRSQNDQFRADLDQIRARLEGLQDLAKSMVQ